MKSLNVILLCCLVVCFSCNNESTNNDDNSASANLIIKFKFDPNQMRLDNFGQPATIPTGNAAQSPIFSRMSANYIEFAPTATTLLGQGDVIFEGPETTAGGDIAIDFQNAIFAGNNETFLTIPLSQVSQGDYEWVRVSLAYQEADIDLRTNGNDITGTLAGFIGYNNYITDLTLNGQTIEVNENKLQGFWGFETLGVTTQGQAPAGATTVPNPLFVTSPVPQGSCVVTGAFENGLTITGNETQDVEVTLSFSVNQSFEWNEVTADGIYEPEIGEQVVNMGLRGLIPSVSN